ncbi:hypothetical protein AHF37_05268 [Paragonimus kellicotti]|nr:hypothetical protein AHF37_05268 [Paragonimus kellicotti]
MYPYESIYDPYLTDFYKKKFSLARPSRKQTKNNTVCCAHRSCHLDRYNFLSAAKSIPIRPFTLYKILVTTADASNAGTTANIYLTLKGERGSALRQSLRKVRKNFRHSNKRTILEPGSTHAFSVVSPDLGDIRSIVIEVNQLLTVAHVRVANKCVCLVVWQHITNISPVCYPFKWNRCCEDVHIPLVFHYNVTTNLFNC